METATVDSWIDFCANEVELPASMWTYPVLGYSAWNAVAYEKAKTDLATALAKVEKYLADRTFLVGEQVTLADITLVSALVYVMKLVADKVYLKPFGNVVRWFMTVVNQPEFTAVVGKVELAKEELLAEGAPKKVKVEPKKVAKKAKKAKEVDEDEEPAPVVEKKAEHPYKIMDREAPSEFSMDAWKKTYSNVKPISAAMTKFWETFDAKGWSLWHMNYDYNAENKRIFMAANAITGFHQRTDEVRKWAFGVQDLLGTEETVLEIQGIWLLRGQVTEHLKQANDDANWYTWTKLAGDDLAPTDEVKARVTAYWCEEDDLEGKPIQDSKVFK